MKPVSTFATILQFNSASTGCIT